MIKLLDFGLFLCLGVREEIPKSTPSTYETLIRNCWHQQPNQRPSFSTIVGIIEK
jgi:hypothetical protein